MILELNIIPWRDDSIVLLPYYSMFESPYIWLCDLNLNVSVHIHSLCSYLPLVLADMTFLEHCGRHLLIDFRRDFLAFVLWDVPFVESCCN